MKRSRLVLLGSIAALVGLVATVPLSVALPLVGVRPTVASARITTGSIWSAGLYGLSVGGFAFGDTGVGLLPLPLLTGVADLEFIAPALRGFVRVSPGRRGLRAVSGTLDLGSRMAPLAATRLDFVDVDAVFDGERCLSARGRITMVLAGDFGKEALPRAMSGTVRCERGMLVAPLVSQSGLERVTLRLRGNGRWTSDLTLVKPDPATITALEKAGFRQGQGGATLRLSGQL